MFAYLKGILQERDGVYAVINVNDVGYSVLVPQSYQMCEGTSYALNVFTVVREDQITLYGFFTVSEKKWFCMLLEVQGVGGKLALAILSSMPYSEIAEAIKSKDNTLLEKVPGLGPRIAERLVRELYDKVMKMDMPSVVVEHTQMEADAEHEQELYRALASLGYKKNEVRQEVEKSVKKDNVSTEQTLLDILQRLDRGDRR